MGQESDDDDDDDDKGKSGDEDMDEDDTVQANIDEMDKFILPGAEEIAKEGELSFVLFFFRFNSYAFCYASLHIAICSLSLPVDSICSEFLSPVIAGVLLVDLQTIHQRIKDNVDVLSHFATKREEGKERTEYLSLLKKDLSTYYSYNNFLIDKLLDIFPVSEVCVIALFSQMS